MTDKETVCKAFGDKTFDEWAAELTADEAEILCSHFVVRLSFVDGGKFHFWSGGEELNALPEGPEMVSRSFYSGMRNVELALVSSERIEGLEHDLEVFTEGGELVDKLNDFLAGRNRR